MATHFSARVYGQVWGTPPFSDRNGNSNFSRVVAFNYAGIESFPTTGVDFYPLPNGVNVGGSYVYSVITLHPNGLNVRGVSYVTDSSVTTLATAAG